MSALTRSLVRSQKAPCKSSNENLDTLLHYKLINANREWKKDADSMAGSRDTGSGMCWELEQKVMNLQWAQKFGDHSQQSEM